MNGVNGVETGRKTYRFIEVVSIVDKIICEPQTHRDTVVTRTGDLRSAVTQRQKTDGKPQHKLSRKVLYGTQPLLLRYEKAYMKREEPHTKRGKPLFAV